MSYLLLQSGGKLLLQGGGALLLQQGDVSHDKGAGTGPSRRRRRLLEEIKREDEEILRFIERFVTTL